MVKSTNFEEIMNFNRSYIVYHTYFLNNEIFFTFTRKNVEGKILTSSYSLILKSKYSKTITLPSNNQSLDGKSEYAYRV